MLNSKKLFLVFGLFFLVSSSSSARVQPYCPPVDTTKYKNLVDNWYNSAGIESFSLSGFSFCGDESKSVSGHIILSSDGLSKLGLGYILTLPATADRNAHTLELNSEIDNRKIAKLVKQFESKKEVKDFVKRFNNTIEKDVPLFVFRIVSGNYFLEYDDEKDEFSRYSLPILMSDDFPLLGNYKAKVEAAGCSINEKNGITYVKNEYWNTISLYSEVEGTCKRSDRYMGGQVYEIEYPIKNDLRTRLKIWFKKLTH